MDSNSDVLAGSHWKAELKSGKPKMGIFINSASPAIAGLFSHAGYDWLLIDSQHGSMEYTTLASMINVIHLGKAKCIVRVAGSTDRNGIQQSLDLGADGILVPYVNNKKEVEEGVSCCLYPTAGTRSVYWPQPATNAHGLLGYVGNANKNILVAVQIETASSIQNIDEICSVKGLDVAFLGQNDLCMSMGLFEREYVFPQMYFSKELNEATQKMTTACAKYGVVPGVFLFGTDRVQEFLKKGFLFISVGNDLHHCLVTAGTFQKTIENVSAQENKPWKHLSSANL